jgi:site-specific DNA-methyltransferase (cytosine-N4-specific)
MGNRGLNILSFANTATNDPYQVYCREHGITPHPARMQPKLAEFFIEFLTDEGDLVMDPFAGSNTTGAVAEKLKRNWLAVELDPDYVNASRARFANL